MREPSSLRRIISQADPIPPEIDADRARRTADDILSDAAYVQPEESLLERSVGWVFEQIGRAFAALTGSGPGSAIGWVIVAALVAAAAWMIYQAIKVAPPPAKEVETTVRASTETRHEPSMWRAEAAALAAAGDHRGALRCRHQAVVSTAVIRRILDDVPGRTAAEFGRGISDLQPELRTDLSSLTDQFEAVWYGGAAIEAGGYATFDATCRRIESSIERAAENGVSRGSVTSAASGVAS